MRNCDYSTGMTMMFAALTSAATLSVATAGMMPDSSGRNGDTKHRQSRSNEQQHERPPHFITTGEALSADVRSWYDHEKELGSIDDLIFDVRQGRLEYAVLSIGGFIGIGDKTVAVPYGALAWNANRNVYQLDASVEELKSLPEFDVDKLDVLYSESWLSTLKSVFGVREEMNEAHAANQKDEYTWLFAERDTERLRGTVKKVERDTVSRHGGKDVCVLIDGQNSNRYLVVLAPANQMNDDMRPPKAGDAVSITAVKTYPHNGRTMYVARTVVLPDGSELILRDRQGTPAWKNDSKRANQNESRRSYYVLASQCDDGEAFGAEDKEFGSVKDIVFDAHSGTAAFATVSVGGIAGIDDTMYAVPCSSFTFDREHDIHLNMSNEDLKKAPKLSEDGADDLNDRQFCERIYSYYGVKPKQFNTKRFNRWNQSSGASKGERRSNSSSRPGSRNNQ